MRKKNKMFVAVLFLLAISMIGATAVSAEETQNMNSTHDGMMHDFESGKEFGQHIKEHNDMFSGTMNPGVHHKGYSTFVR